MFGPADVFPYAEGRSYAARRAAVRLAALHAHLGIRRAVVVQANCHGADHAALLDALARSEGRYRGVALLGRMRPQRRYARCTTPACAGPASTSCPIWAARRTRPSSTMWSA